MVLFGWFLFCGGFCVWLVWVLFCFRWLVFICLVFCLGYFLVPKKGAKKEAGIGSHISHIVEKFSACSQATPLLAAEALLGKLNHIGQHC